MNVETIGIVTLTLALVAFWVFVSRRALLEAKSNGEATSNGGSITLTLTAWLVATASFAASGIVATDARLMILALAPAFGGAAYLAMSRFGRGVAIATPWTVLIGYMVFRLPLELLLNQSYLSGRLPVQMTFHGLNYDIAIGASAILLAAWAAKSTPPRLVLIGWNTLGIGILSVTGTVAFLSMPTPFRQFNNEPSTILLTTFPYSWVPTFLAASALAGHVLIYRKLQLERCIAVDSHAN